MKQKYLLRISKIIFLFILTLIYSNSTYGQDTDLFISEYSEGSSNNKYVEIYNGTGANVNLSNYQLWRISNGGNWPEATISLSGTLAKGDVYVVYNGSSVSTISNNGDLASSIIIFNGDDAFGLAKTDGISGFTLIDGVGEDGSDPGTGWAVAGITNATKDHTLVRKLSVTSPNNDWDESRGTDASDSEWIVYAKDTWTNIGYHGATWTGASNTDWATAGNWDSGVPSNSNNVTVPDVANAPIIGATTGAVTNDLTITEPDGINIIAGGSLIVSGTSSGNITYTRNLATTNWYLVSSPVVGQTYNDAYVTANGIASGTGSNRGIAPYVTGDDSWDYMQAGESLTFTPGSGYSVKRSTAGDISFTGTMPVDNVSIAITNGYNLVGNPYPSYIAANTNADNANNILTVNNSILSEATLWMWNQSSSSYDVINQGSSSMDIAPAQGFFMKTSGNNTLSITEAMQSHQSSDSFQRLSNERPEISIVLSDGENTRDTDIYYIDGTTTGFDNGYDSTTFSGAANSFSIYTHLVANSNGQDLAIQSLPNSSLDTMIIPVGITAAAGEEISISANAINLPEGVNIYLEDKNDDSFTLLDSTSIFTTTPDEDLNGIGRFYLHTTATALSDNQVSLTNVSMYVVDSSLTITGVHTANASVRVYDLLGKELVNTSFQGTGLNEIDLPILTTGVYVVKLETQTEAISKKIIIKK